MKTRLRNLWALLLITVALTGYSAQEVPPPKVVIVEPQLQRAEKTDRKARSYNYEQKVESSKVLIPEKKARKFVAEFAQLFSGKEKRTTSFSIRINPGIPSNNPGTDPQTINDFVRSFGRPFPSGHAGLSPAASGYATG